MIDLPPVEESKAARRQALSADIWRTAYSWFILLACLAALIAVVSLAYGQLLAPVSWARDATVISLGLVIIGLVFVGAAIARRAGGVSKELEAWRLIGDALPFACICVDRRGRGIYWNGKFDTYFPRNSHAPLAAFKSGLGGDEAAGAQIQSLMSAVLAGDTQYLDLSWHGDRDGVSTHTGSWQWVRLTARQLDEQDSTYLWIIEDKTAEHRLTGQIALQKQRLDAFLEHAPVGFYEADADGKLEYVNSVLANWLGKTLEEVIRSGLNLADILPEPPSADGGEARLHRDRFDRDRPGRDRPDGADALNVQVAIISDTAGVDAVARGVVRDLATERSLEKALAHANERFRKFFAETSSPLAIVGQGRAIIESNQAWRVAANGRVPSDMATAPAGMVAEIDQEKFGEWFDEVVENQSTGSTLCVRLAVPSHDAESGQAKAENEEDEEPVPHEASFSAMRIEAADGKLDEIVLQLHDVPQTVGAQSAQALKMQAVGQLAGGVAHDFNNLLTAMIGFCDLLLGHHSPGDPSFGDIMQIKQNANRAANLVRQLLAFSRQQTLRPTVLKITDILADLNSLLRRLIGVDVTLDIVHGRDLGSVRVDQGQLEQVIINLAVNARDAMEEGGTLTITTRPVHIDEVDRRGDEVVAPGEYVAIDVRDTGTGMSPETVERIFEPFYTTKDVGAGTGLGLATVYGIMKQTGGHIFVETALGHGTSFEILLPAVANVEAKQGDEKQVAADLTGAGTILLVEDEDAVRLFGARALRGKGYTVVEAEHGPAALIELEALEGPLDLLITDVMMPEMDGPTLVRKIRDIIPDLPVIIISGYAEDSFRKDVGEATDISFLAKPFSLQELAAKVKDVIGEGRQS